MSFFQNGGGCLSAGNTAISAAAASGRSSSSWDYLFASITRLTYTGRSAGRCKCRRWATCSRSTGENLIDCMFNIWSLYFICRILADKHGACRQTRASCLFLFSYCRISLCLVTSQDAAGRQDICPCGSQVLYVICVVPVYTAGLNCRSSLPVFTAGSCQAVEWHLEREPHRFRMVFSFFCATSSPYLYSAWWPGSRDRVVRAFRAVVKEKTLVFASIALFGRLFSLLFWSTTSAQDGQSIFSVTCQDLKSFQSFFLTSDCFPVCPCDCLAVCCMSVSAGLFDCQLPLLCMMHLRQIRTFSLFVLSVCVCLHSEKYSMVYE